MQSARKFPASLRLDSQTKKISIKRGRKKQEDTKALKTEHPSFFSLEDDQKTATSCILIEYTSGNNRMFFKN